MAELLDPQRRLAPAARFVVAGAINTALSVAVYQGMLFVSGHLAAYIVAYAAGIAFAYFAYARHVFEVAMSAGRFMGFALFYVASGGVGTLINALLIEQIGLHARISVFATIIVMLPLNYYGSKWCLRAAPGRGT